jgi:energy-coupling factor transporter transmembrane protein EcfT
MSIVFCVTASISLILLFSYIFQVNKEYKATTNAIGSFILIIIIPLFISWTYIVNCVHTKFLIDNKVMYYAVDKDSGKTHLEWVEK